MYNTALNLILTSQCPVEFHVVASCGILHHKITVPTHNGKLTCLLQKLKQTYSIFLQVNDENQTDWRWNDFNQLFSFLAQNTISCQKNKLTVSRTTNRIDTSTRFFSRRMHSPKKLTPNFWRGRRCRGPNILPKVIQTTQFPKYSYNLFIV